jgi:galactosamine-6-phosphate isomerase
MIGFAAQCSSEYPRLIESTCSCSDGHQRVARPPPQSTVILQMFWTLTRRLTTIEGTHMVELRDATRNLFRPEVLRDYDELSATAADIVVKEIRSSPALLVCLATGGSPLGTFEVMSAAGASEPTLFKQLRVLKLDEWGGLGGDTPGSCEAYLQENIIKPWRIPREHYLGFDGCSADPDSECQRISTWLAQHGPIDIAILGLGLNGHLGLNEPADFLQPFAHRALLTEEAREHTMLAQLPRKPDYGLTLGMAELLQSRRILLLVSGKSKRQPLARLRQREITPSFPASFLWLHPNVTLLCDEDAGSC